MERQEAKVAIKFCGLCTEYINVRAIVRVLRHMQAEMGFVLLPFSSAEENVDVVVILNSCNIGCADRTEVRNKAAQAVVIAGEVVNGKQISPEAVPDAVADALSKALPYSTYSNLE